MGQGKTRDSVLAANRRKPYLLKQMLPISIFDISKRQMVSVQIIEAFLQIVTQDSWDGHMARPRNQTGSVSSSSQPVGHIS